MQISRLVLYAVQATLELATAPGSPVRSMAAASRNGLPERFQTTAVMLLVDRNILAVDDQCGFRLSNDVNELSLLDILEAIEGPLLPNQVQWSGLDQPAQRKLMDLQAEIVRLTRDKLASLKLVDIANAHAPSSATQ